MSERDWGTSRSTSPPGTRTVLPCASLSTTSRAVFSTTSPVRTRPSFVSSR